MLYCYKVCTKYNQNLIGGELTTTIPAFINISAADVALWINWRRVWRGADFVVRRFIGIWCSCECAFRLWALNAFYIFGLHSLKNCKTGELIKVAQLLCLCRITPAHIKVRKKVQVYFWAQFMHRVLKWHNNNILRVLQGVILLNLKAMQ